MNEKLSTKNNIIYGLKERNKYIYMYISTKYNSNDLLYPIKDIKGKIKYVDVDNKGKVSKIIINTFSNKYKNKQPEIGYMLNLNWLGMGILRKEKDLFLTIEEAQAECDRRNAKSTINLWI